VSTRAVKVAAAELVLLAVVLVVALAVLMPRAS
jgi:hypothetical protein